MEKEALPTTVWLDDPQKLGKQVLPLIIGGEQTRNGQRDASSTEQAELCGEPLWPSDFKADSVDIYTNTLCHGAGSEGDDRLCTYCYFDTSKLKDPNMMTLESLDQILGWATADGSSIQRASVLGGEFALHPEAPEIIKRIDESGLGLNIVTSGSDEFRALLDDGEIVDILRQTNQLGYSRNLVAISLDSIDEAANDSQRGRGAFLKACTTINALKFCGISFRINATVTKATIDGMDDLYDFAATVGAEEVLAHLPSDVGRGRSLINSRGMTNIPSSPEWNEKVVAAAEKWQVLSSRNGRRMQWVVCEIAGSDYSDFGCELIKRNSTLQFVPQISESNSDIPVVACTLSMAKANTMSAYILRGGLLRKRAGMSELFRAEEAWSEDQSECPLRPGTRSGCIYY